MILVCICLWNVEKSSREAETNKSIVLLYCIVTFKFFLENIVKNENIL